MNSETTLEPEEKSKAKKLTICPFSTVGVQNEFKEDAMHCGPHCEWYDEGEDQCVVWTFLVCLRQLKRDIIKER